MSWGKGSPPSQVLSEQEMESREQAPSACKVVRVEVTNFTTLTLNPGKAKQELGVGILN